MDIADESGQTPKRRGRPKGAKDRVKRARRTRADSVFNFKLGSTNLTDLLAAGREIDLAGLLRLAQAHIGVKIIEEVDALDNCRRASLCDAAMALHRMEVEVLKLEAELDPRKAAGARASIRDPAPSRFATDVAFSLADFRKRQGEVEP
jgi:hypothetical protein